MRAANGLAGEKDAGHTGVMKTKTIALTTALTLVCSIALSDSTGTPIRGPVYTDDGRLNAAGRLSGVGVLELRI